MDRSDVHSSLSLPIHGSRNSPFRDVYPDDDTSQTSASWKRHTVQEFPGNQNGRLAHSPVQNFRRTSQELPPVAHPSPRFQKQEEMDPVMERAKTDMYINNLTRTPRYGLGRHKTYADMLAEMNPEDPFKAEYQPSLKSPKEKDTQENTEPQSAKTPRTRRGRKSLSSISNNSADDNPEVKADKEKSGEKNSKTEIEQSPTLSEDKTDKKTRPVKSKLSPSKSATKVSPNKQSPSHTKASSDIKSNKQSSTQNINSLSNDTDTKPDPAKLMKDTDNKEMSKKKLAKPFTSKSSQIPKKIESAKDEDESAAIKSESINKEENGKEGKPLDNKNTDNKTALKSNTVKSSSKEEKSNEKEGKSPKASTKGPVAKNGMNELLSLTEKEKTEIRLSLVNLKKKRVSSNIDPTVTVSLEKEGNVTPEAVSSTTKKKKVQSTLTNLNDKKAPGCFLNPQSVSSHLYCSICGEVFRDPQRALCGHSFCRKCISNWLKDSKTCPEDRKPIYLKQLHHDFILENIIADIMVCCPYRRAGCDYVGPLQELRAHKEGCQQCPDTRPGFHRESKTLTP